ncbi:unnamed protein product [Pleuronectes platessa]|uniref:Uncharacterized protein n=1 Tax=Pleuronectes platessa TaxID=8262 RepID=A0A9N7YZI5_PLEPL|nr:unnamed protein product [Pleuronectes platessa]
MAILQQKKEKWKQSGGPFPSTRSKPQDNLGCRSHTPGRDGDDDGEGAKFGARRLAAKSNQRATQHPLLSSVRQSATLPRSLAAWRNLRCLGSSSSSSPEEEEARGGSGDPERRPHSGVPADSWTRRDGRAL